MSSPSPIRLSSSHPILNLLYGPKDNRELGAESVSSHFVEDEKSISIVEQHYVVKDSA